MNDLLNQFEIWMANTDPNDSIIDGIIEFCENHAGFDWGSGVTRVAIWHKSWDFVIKISRGDYDTDYCEAEVQHYERAKFYKVDRICLPIELYTTLSNGIKLYKQTRYSFDTNSMYHQEYDTYLRKRNCTGDHRMTYRIKNDCDWLRRADRKWLERVIQLYGKKFARSMEMWLEENRINDLHNCNTGWLNGRPILLDYAGFHD